MKSNNSGWYWFISIIIIMNLIGNSVKQKEKLENLEEMLEMQTAVSSYSTKEITNKLEGCVGKNQARLYIGRYGCVIGLVRNTFQNIKADPGEPDTYSTFFGPDENSFYVFADWFVGRINRCIRVVGEIRSNNNGVPFMYTMNWGGSVPENELALYDYSIFYEELPLEICSSYP